MTAPTKRASSQEGFFWKTKTLEEMSSAEWESLCDGCARCCLEKLEDEDTGKIYFTHVSCKLLDSGLCACKDYQNRSDKVPDCVRLTPANVRTLNWLPPSCGYKLVAEGRDMGSVVFPDSVLKIYLTASPEARAQRRYKQLMDKGMGATMTALLQDIRARDERDTNRATAPLKKATDAVLIDTTDLSAADAVAQVLELYKKASRAL